MPEHTDSLIGGLVSVDDELEREFEARLVESSRLAFRIAFSVLRQREDAEDVAQEAFVKAHRSFRQLRDRDRFRAWLVRLTWRLALNRRRSDRRRLAREQAATTAPPPTADDGYRSQRAGELWQAIDRLPEKLRLVIVLAAIDGHDIREAAQLLELPEGTVKSRLFHARRRLREYLECTPPNPIVR
jgi:RNA polymerase sigma-70 factor (ECF subfamily)